MADLEYDPNAIIGERPLNLHPRFTAEQDGSIAAQLKAQGFYRGIAVAKLAVEEYFADQPEILQELQSIFLIETEASRDPVTVFPAAVRGPETT